MRKILLISTAAAGVMFATAPAFAAECRDELLAYNDKVTTTSDYRTMLTPGLRADVRRLRDAALTLHNAGQEDACEAVVEAIKEMVEKSPMASDQSTDASDWNMTEIERLKSAQSLDELQGQLRAEAIIGTDVRNLDNEDLGEIEDLIIARKESDQSYAIISHGGFIGLGEKQIAVPLERLKVTRDKDVFVLNVSEKELEAAPDFERGQFEMIDDETWRRTNDEFFKN